MRHHECSSWRSASIASVHRKRRTIWASNANLTLDESGCLRYPKYWLNVHIPNWMHNRLINGIIVINPKLIHQFILYFHMSDFCSLDSFLAPRQRNYAISFQCNWSLFHFPHSIQLPQVFQKESSRLSRACMPLVSELNTTRGKPEYPFLHWKTRRDSKDGNSDGKSVWTKESTDTCFLWRANSSIEMQWSSLLRFAKWADEW